MLTIFFFLYLVRIQRALDEKNHKEKYGNRIQSYLIIFSRLSFYRQFHFVFCRYFKNPMVVYSDTQNLLQDICRSILNREKGVHHLIWLKRYLINVFMLSTIL